MHLHQYDCREGERKIDINFKRIFHDLKNLDWCKVAWMSLIRIVTLHIFSIYAVLLLVTLKVSWITLAWSYVLYLHSMIGTTMGSHRLWAHKSYKARMPLRIWLMICQTMSMQDSIYEWARDHRTHHKCSETDGDPHNAQRGFFFSHMGWLMYRKHPLVIENGKKLDLSDLETDPVVMWQKSNYLWMAMTWCFVVPTIVPWYFWGESWVTALMVAGFLRYTVNLHLTWCVNSLAHWIGSKPFDRSIFPSQNGLVSFITLGEGWHNYHHVFPWDYRTSELGGWFNALLSGNFTTTMIDLMAMTGQVYDRKAVSQEMWEKRMARTGNGSFSEKYAFETE